MKNVILAAMLLWLVSGCANPAGKGETKQSAADSVNAIDKAQEKFNQLVDTAQVKGEQLLNTTGDSIKEKLLDPVRAEAKKAGEKVKETVNEAKERIKQ